MERTGGDDRARMEALFESFNKAWLKYWESYVTLQNKLYESIKVARDVQWLAATDQEKLREINSLQRELFASVPRRLDYMPLGQVSQDADTAPSKIRELDDALSSEQNSCKALEEAIVILRAQTKAMQEAFGASRT